MKIIIDMESGQLKSVFTDNPSAIEDCEFILREYKNRDDERSESEYYQIQRLIDSGLVTDVLNDCEQSAFDEESKVLAPDGRAMLLIKSPAIASHDLLLQKAYATYIDGFMTAIGIMNRAIFSMHRDANIAANMKHEISKLFQPVREKCDTYYDNMVSFLNSEEFLKEDDE